MVAVRAVRQEDLIDKILKTVFFLNEREEPLPDQERMAAGEFQKVGAKAVEGEAQAGGGIVEADDETVLEVRGRVWRQGEDVGIGYDFAGQPPNGGIAPCLRNRVHLSADVAGRSRAAASCAAARSASPERNSARA